ncbi:MAG TPA: MBL fold metallo-hydrolase [Desulfurococcales archaeon]|nr:MBL fold metallo-hydrolase [Desulfurococcales archaeon]
MVECGRVKVVIDPGVAVMHPSYPAPSSVKIELRDKGYMEIRKAISKADIIIITHYHYDHYLHEESDIKLYMSKTILSKDPNKYINDSQRDRAFKFYSILYGMLGLNLNEILLEPVYDSVEYPDLVEDLVEALSRDYGNYSSRRKQLLNEGRKWFNERVRKWKSYRRIPEVERFNVRVHFADNRVFDYRGVRIKFTKPLFHGVEYSRVGWIVSVILESCGRKVYFTSDVNGPIIEDYASMIIDENPNILILDGPPTYLLGYTLNRINLQRAIDNAIRILKETSKLELVLYDHHLVREPKFRERTISVWRTAEKQGIRLLTVSEYMGFKPVVLQYSS